MTKPKPIPSLTPQQWDFSVKCAKGTFVCSKCGDDWFDDKFTYDIHETYCKGKPQSDVPKETKVKIE